MTRMQRILGARRLVLSTVFMLAMIGVLSYNTMPQQEDPFFPYRGGVIKTIFPGADAERIRELVVRHLEREIAEVADLNFVRSTVRNNVALTTVVMYDYVYDTDAKWDEVRRAMVRAEALFPPGVETPELDDRVITTSTGTYAVTGSEDLEALGAGARELRDALMQLGDIIRVDIHGEPGEQVNIALEDETAKRYQISAHYLAQQLNGRMQLLGAGSLVAGSTRLTLKPETEFRSIEELRATPIRLPAGDVVPLAAVAEVWLGDLEPTAPRMWHDGEPAVLVDIVAAQNKINAVAYGERMREVVDSVRPRLAPLAIEEMFYQPGRVKARLDDLSKSLVVAIGIILAVLIFAMGIRLALLVALILPAVAAMSLALYAIGGGVLHQMAVIGLIVALGILVDNAIVMIEEVQWQLNQGNPPMQAALNAIQQLAKPLAAATGTTIAAFIPLAISKSGVGDFTRAVPIMIMISLAVSYFFAIVVTPMLGERFLRPRVAKGDEAKIGWPERIGRWAGAIGSKHAVITLAVAAIGSALLIAWGGKNLESEFFPQADRNQLLVDVAMSEGTTQEETTRVARILERELRTYEDVLEVHGFVGHSGPRFYYNLLRRPDQPNRARLVAKSTGVQGNLRIIAQVREFANTHLPEAEVVAKILSQGPPIDSPIEVRVYNEDPVKLAEATEMILAAVQTAPGAIDAAHNLGLGAPELKVEIDDAHALQYGLSRADIAQALLSRSQGIPIGTYRASYEPVPIRVRSMAGENSNPAELASVLVFNAQGEGIPLGAVADVSLSWQPGAIYSYNQRRVAVVSSELDFGYVFSQVMNEVAPRLAKLNLPEGTEYEFGGEAEASGDANSALAGTAPLGLILLLLFLIWQFNSFRRLVIVLISIPLAFVGVIPGLALLGIPFGFQPMLGCIALIGIVVNNAIVLIDVLDQNLSAGKNFVDAMTDAVERRTRPIMLTGATTIAGLIPLAFSDATMWPPMAWPIITGLLASTVLTLFVVPALCRLLLAFRDGGTDSDKAGKKGNPKVTATSAASIMLLAAGLSLAGLVPNEAQAAKPQANVEQPAVATTQPRTEAEERALISLKNAMLVARSLPAVEAEQHALAAAEALIQLERRAAYAPQIGLSYRGTYSENPPVIDTANGPMDIGEQLSRRGELQLNQPLVNIPRTLYAIPAAKLDADAQALKTQRAADNASYGTAALYIAQLKLAAQRNASRSLLKSFDARYKRVNLLVESGRALQADALDVRLAGNDVRQRLAEIDQQMQLVAARLASITGRPAAWFMELKKPQMQVELPEQTAAVKLAEANRPELAALRRQIDAQDLRRQGTRAEGLPTLGAQLSYINSDGEAFAPEEDYRASLQMEWQLFSGGTRSARVDALQAKVAQLQAQLREQRRLISIEIAEVYELQRLAQTTQRLASAAVESAKARLQTRNDRFEAGRETVDEVLQAEAQLRLQETRAINANYDLLLAKLQGRYVLGLNLFAEAAAD